MSKNIKGVIPKWRFLEFKGNGDWERKKLGEMAFIVNDKIAIEKLNAETYISTENMLPNFAGVSTASQLPQTGNFTKFKAGDILVSNIRPYLKKVWRSNKTGGASNDVIVFRSNSDVDSKFLEFVLKNELFIKYAMKNAKGLKMPRGDKESMLIYSVCIPPYPTFSEQQKIADCLSSIDDLISAEEKKLSLLNDYKKGWMQKLFPAEGKTVPEWRFPEFMDSESWNKRKLEDIIIAQASTLALNKLELKQNGCPVYGADGIVGYIDSFQQGENYISMVKDGSGAGRLHLNASHSSILGTLSCLKSRDKTKFLLEWIYYCLESIDFSIYIKGSGIPHIYYSDYKNRVISIPNLPEQSKIAEFLSRIDDLLSRQTDKIEALKQHKKALMQGLFPSVEEVWK